MKGPEPQTIDEYISSFPEETQEALQKVRATIRSAAPDAKEAIKYAIPTFILHGNLVHFGGYKHHIGFYPAPAGIDAFDQELAAYRTGKGTLQFPLDKDLPLDLIKRIVEFRAKQNLEKAQERSRAARKA